MSDEGRTDQLLERKVDEVLGALDRGDVDVSSAARPYLETLGLLAYGLTPLDVPAEERRRLLAAVEASEAEPVAQPEGRRAGGSGGRWMLRAAAIAAVALLALSGMQARRLARQNEQIAAQAARIERLQGELAEVLPAAQRPPEWMASSGTELCALSPRRAAGENSKGWLFVREDHQHWYVAVEGLPPAPGGHVYELWFLVDGQLVSGGTLSPDEAGRAILTSETMPNPVTGIAVTLEPDDGDASPSDMMVLYGDEVMLVL